MRDARGRSILHLKDASKLKRILKSPLLPMMLLDFAEGALLNQKLKEIEAQLVVAIEKTDQQQRATLHYLLRSCVIFFISIHRQIESKSCGPLMEPLTKQSH